MTQNVRATRREWTGLGVLALPCVLYSMDLTVLNLAIPHLTADLNPSAAQMLWIVDIYGFLLAGFLITMGTLGDRIGRRRLLMIGAVAFGLASTFAAFATSASMLIAARALLGVAAATLSPSTLSLLRNMFLDSRERTFAIGVWAASFAAGGAIGPLIGGVLLEYFWWGSVFLAAVPVMVLLLILAPILLPEFRDPNAGRLDLFSAALSLIAVLAIIYAIKHFAVHGAGRLPLALIVTGSVVGALFVRRQRLLADPLIDLRLFGNPVFSTSLALNMLSLFIAFGFFLLIAQYFQLVLGMAPLEAGLWTAPSGLAFVAGSMLAPQLVRYVSRESIIVGGFVVTALGFALVAIAGRTDQFELLLCGFLIFCLGLAPVGALTTDLVVGCATPERAGAASAISETSFELGGALGIAVLGSIAAASYRSGMSASTANEIPSEALRIARDTLGGAVAVAHDLSSGHGEALLTTARAAFTQALELTAWISVALALGAAILSVLVLQRKGPSRVGDGP